MDLDHGVVERRYA